MHRLLPILLLPLLPLCGGCFLFGGASPSAVNIQLRKEKQSLQSEIGTLQQKVDAQQQVIQGLRNTWPAIETLPPERLGKLFTTHGLELGRLTGGMDTDGAKPGDEGLRVYVAPVDESGQPIKMAGAFTVEAYDLAEEESPLVGKWTFDLSTVRASWRGTFLDYTYVLQCPWQDRLPAHPKLTLKVTFLDELTQVPFETQTVVEIQVPAAATQPASAPASQPTQPVKSKPVTSRPAEGA